MKSYVVLNLTTHREKELKSLRTLYTQHLTCLGPETAVPLTLKGRRDALDVLHTGTERFPALPYKDHELFLSETTPAQAEVSLGSSCSSTATLSGTKTA